MSAWMVIFGVLTVLSACGVVFSAKSLNSALWLVATLFFVAVHFALLGADFIAALQILVYAGAIMILVVFVIMLLGIDKEADRGKFSLPNIAAMVIVAAFLSIMAYVIGSEVVFSVAEVSSESSVVSGSPAEVGKVLFTDYLYAFEIIALLLLAAIIGAVVLAHEKRRPLAAGRGLAAMHASNQDEQKRAEG